MRLGLPSTLIRRAFSSKTRRFENSLESGSKRMHNISCKCEPSKKVENASKWKRWPKISQAIAFVACDRVLLAWQRAIQYSFSNVLGPVLNIPVYWIIAVRHQRKVFTNFNDVFLLININSLNFEMPIHCLNLSIYTDVVLFNVDFFLQYVYSGPVLLTKWYC